MARRAEGIEHRYRAGCRDEDSRRPDGERGPRAPPRGEAQGRQSQDGGRGGQRGFVSEAEAQPQVKAVATGSGRLPKRYGNALLEDLYEISEYETGITALAGIPEDPPDLVLLDISLPEMDGTEVLRRLREQSDLAAIPIIALTAHAMAGDEEKFLAAGFDGYVSKPIVDVSVLMDAIERCLSSRG